MATSFLLRIEFAGIILFVKNPDGRKIGVVMPDARFKKSQQMQHADGTNAAPHVGYLRFDAANLTGVKGLPVSNGSDAPPYEVVHRFAAEELDIGVALDGTPSTGSFQVPDFDEIAPVRTVRDGLFDTAIPAGVNMRMVIPGGALSTAVETGTWRITGELRPDGRETVGQYGGLSYWDRFIEGTGLTVRLRPFGATEWVSIPLVPSTLPDGTQAIMLKIANLCQINPMEWPELELREVREPDVDFKWVHRMLRLRDGEDPVRYPDRLLPHPDPIPDPNQGILADCFPGQITAPF